MSHFAVTVIGNNVQEQLAPYQENNMGDCPQEYLEFFEGSEEDGYDFDELEGKYGYWENPNAKWDYYQVGSRWSGFLKIKPEFTRFYESDKVDSALKEHIDFEGMMDEAGEHARKEYKQVAEYLQKYGEGHKKWDDYYLTKVEDENDSMTISQAREEYHTQPSVKNKREIGEQGIWINIDDYVGITEEQYVDNARKQSVRTFAILKEGKWAERGKMGWWACVTNEKDKETWESIYHNILNSTEDHERITIVDCHI